MSKVFVRAASAVAAVALLVGCSAQPGTAAVVDGRTISQADLDRTHADLTQIIPQLDARTTLVALMVGPYFIEAAEENGVGVSESQARDFAEQNAAAAGVESAFGDGAVEVLRFSLAAEQLGGLPDGQAVVAGVEDEILAADIDVNPRYGDLDPATGQLVAEAPSWLVGAGE